MHNITSNLSDTAKIFNQLRSGKRSNSGSSSYVRKVIDNACDWFLESRESSYEALHGDGTLAKMACTRPTSNEQLTLAGEDSVTEIQRLRLALERSEARHAEDLRRIESKEREFLNELKLRKALIHTYCQIARQIAPGLDETGVCTEVSPFRSCKYDEL